MEPAMANGTGEEPAPSPNLSLISTQLSWQRSDLANLRTLLAWTRTAVAMIGFGFTIYNFYRGFFERLVTEGRADAARNLGLTLVAAGTFAMAVGVVNYRGIATSLSEMEADLQIAAQFSRRWIYSYVLSGIVMFIGLITLLFMLRFS
jgi:putative membrane protein